MISEQTAQAFLHALISHDAERYSALLAENCSLRLWRWDGSESHRPRQRVVARLLEESASWADADIETFTVLAGEHQMTIEFRIQATENGRYVEHNRSAFLSFSGDHIGLIDVYCAAPIPSARRNNYIAPATLTEAEIHQLLRDFQNTTDVREYVIPNVDRYDNLHIRLQESGDPHPGSNDVMWANWTAGEADQRIEEVIEFHHKRNIGFWWFTGLYDSPADLGERLKQHGLIWAGDNLTMVRVGLDNPDIPTNPNVEVVALNEASDDDIEAGLQCSARCFNWTKDQADPRRSAWFDQIRGTPIAKDHLLYLAKLDGVPVAFGHTLLKNGLAFLAGAATLPNYRNRKVYSTLLRRRLVDAARRGYQISMIYAGPMSRRVAVRYGFKTYNKFDIYAWMPVIDMAVIKGLIVDE